MFTTESGIPCFNHVSVKIAFLSSTLLTAKRISSVLREKDIHQIKLGINMILLSSEVVVQLASYKCTK